MNGAQNDRKPGVLMDLPASSMGTVILATEAIVVTAHPNMGLSLWAWLKSNGITNESNFISLIGNNLIIIYGSKTRFDLARG
jgi:hypothetical protein